ncbi:MAG TPA: winged helix-turn-helix domain-containing protein [Bryobacteraceae bacterium]|jgi:Tol biopolymer transport system component/DNA-binding winged helix-turn-helix (wHTH) protein|nr:winged helix-turn-helix domain-containing protein [Bryobacteraceae bacterium]
MQPQFESPARLAFGPFEVNVPERQLVKSGVRVRLSGQPFQVLLTLLAHPGDVVTNEQLCERIWKEGTFVDFEHGLHAAVNKLRRALGDSAGSPRYIETVPGRGYRFIGAMGRQPVPISVRLGNPPPPPAGAELSPARSKLGRRWWIVAAVTLPIGVLGIWAASHFRQTPTDERVLRLQINPPAGSEFTFGTQAAGISLSPDGKTVAYVATDHGKAALWVQPLDGATARVLAGTEDAGWPFWSPDSKSIAFFAHGKLQRVNLAGGVPQTICDIGQARGGSSTEDGRILFGGWNSGLFQVAASGGRPSSLTTLDASRGEVFHYWPQMLPGGRFLYFVRSTNSENSGVYAASLAKPRERVQLLATDTNALYAPAADGVHNNRKGYLLWLRGGTLVAQDFDAATLKLSGEPHPVADPVTRIGTTGQMQVSISATGILLYNSSSPLRQFRWVDRTGKPRGPVGEPAFSAFFHLSPDGRRIVVARGSPVGADLWMLDVGRGLPSRFTSRPGVNIGPVWSPDGRTVVFSSDAPRNLFLKSASGAGEEQRLTRSASPQFPLDWSRDGRFILYEEATAPGDLRSLWTLPVAPGDAEPRPYLRKTSNETMGQFSPDARWVAFQSDESGRYEVYIDTFPEPRRQVRISTGGGVMPEWGAGGRELFYISPDSMLMSVSLKPGTGSLEASAPHALFPLLVIDTDVSPYDVARDGQRFLVLETAEHATQPLTVIVNWPVLVNRTAQ